MDIAYDPEDSSRILAVEHPQRPDQLFVLAECGHYVRTPRQVDTFRVYVCRQGHGDAAATKRVRIHQDVLDRVWAPVIAGKLRVIA